MKFTPVQLSSLSFHDATVQRIEERPDYISISIDFAFIGPPHPESEGKEWTVRDCLFECFGVRKSEKEEWDDTRAPKAHTEPQYPIEELLDEEVVDGCLVLGGFTRKRNWGIWRIEAREYSLSWKARDEFKKANKALEP